MVSADTLQEFNMNRSSFKHSLLHLGMAFLIISCGKNVRPQKFQHGDYQVRDRGGFEAVITGKACSADKGHALISAKQAANFNLRSLIGDKPYISDLKVIRKFREEEKYCYEIQAIAKPS